MKSVSVSLADGWEREEWKLKRLFADSYELGASDGSHCILSVNLKCSDPRLSAEARHGFPVTGLAVRVRIDLAYITGPPKADNELAFLISVESTDAYYPLPPGFSTKLSERFDRTVGEYSDLCIFHTLKGFDRTLGDMWMDAIMTNKPDDAFPIPIQSGEVVGKIDIDCPLGVSLAFMVADIVCLKCERSVPSVRLDFDDHRFVWDTSCSTCSRQLALNGSYSNIYGTDCAVSRIRTVSGWVYCGCGVDGVFLSAMRPVKPANVKFSCSCETVSFAYLLEPLISLPGERKSPPSEPRDADAHRQFKEGGSLPSNGACKHYKKSFRWIKYPCCSEWFACNQCHDARVRNHECDNDGADLMLCGFCTKEQPLAAVCVGCGKDTTPGWSVKDKVDSGPPTRRRMPFWKKHK